MATNEIPGRVMFLDGHGNLPKIEVATKWSDAEIYLHGAHITHFQQKNRTPLLFMSQCSRFQTGAAIRGGIPVIFPWFGPREGQVQHGFARTASWRLTEILPLASGEIVLKLQLPDSPEAALWPKFSAEYVVTIGEALSAELIITNESDQNLTLETCLHTYFTVGDIGAVTITGLKGADFLDKTQNFARKREERDEIAISEETDRVYVNTKSTVEIHDEKLKRRIFVEKTGSNSTVVWNPWIAKAQQMPDFGNDEYPRMVCVESGNVDADKVTIPAGKTSSLKVILSTKPL